jgi:hypothetical protein
MDRRVGNRAWRFASENAARNVTFSASFAADTL